MLRVTPGDDACGLARPVGQHAASGPPCRAVVNLSSIQSVIVDLDGTMVDTLGDFEVALNRMLAELRLPPVDRAFIEHTVGKGSEHLIRNVLSEQLRRLDPAVGLGVCPAAQPEARYEQAWKSYQAHYRAINGDFSEVYPGVREGLSALQSRGLRLACLTNKPRTFALDLLQAKRLDHFFPVVFGGDSFERKKPDPLPLIRTCEALGVSPAQTLMIGDSENDARAARSAGCPVVLVTYGYNHGQPVQAVDADACIDRIDQLVWTG